MIDLLDYVEDIKMTLDQLQVFITITELGSFRAASQKMHRAQSAVSYAIKELESQLGFSLFERSTYRPELTTKGMAFLARAKHLVCQSDELSSYAQQLKLGTEPYIRLSVAAIFPLTIITKSLKETHFKFPSTEIKFEIEVLSGDKLLLDQSVDLAITDILGPKERIQGIPLQKVKMWQVCAADHPLSKLIDSKTLKVEKDELRKFPQIVVRSTGKAVKRSSGVINLTNRWTVNDFGSKRELILNGLGWGGMPEHWIETDLAGGRLSLLHPEPFEVPMWLCWPSEKDLGPAANYLKNQIRHAVLGPKS
jgi:DNA-binding transcriptional LysR family regulator